MTHSTPLASVPPREAKSPCVSAHNGDGRFGFWSQKAWYSRDGWPDDWWRGKRFCQVGVGVGPYKMWINGWEGRWVVLKGIQYIQPTTQQRNGSAFQRAFWFKYWNLPLSIKSFLTVLWLLTPLLDFNLSQPHSQTLFLHFFIHNSSLPFCLSPSYLFSYLLFFFFFVCRIRKKTIFSCILGVFMDWWIKLFHI